MEDNLRVRRVLLSNPDHVSYCVLKIAKDIILEGRIILNMSPIIASKF